MTKQNTIDFIDNPAVKNREDCYVTLTVDTAKVLESWKNSLYAFEWLTNEGLFRPSSELPEREQERQISLQKALKEGAPLEKPVLGIGLMDNVEIGAGRAVFLTLAQKEISTIPVHIPKNHRTDFETFLA